ncbi:MAG: 50S ribosomal protein L21 [Synergistaceae bacterium]|nr:50S ribosomal protein L21 [Synergistaceae bacterium]MBQ3626779.1 50S ribosomal protein L21 [Synergistaceae bacterium]MBQ6910137.1 50S ribosomal protein L21 [Synergistaceae bacterium]MBQ7569422.1 50S ribosomal protein L21 [Synergistaceae bacterium]MBQ9896582.1 50S ribosomal protein L21 [Synergistaceae bacterium]
MYAVIETGGKQYRVQAGDKLRVERLEGEEHYEIIFDKVLMAGDAETGEAKFGTPYLAGANVTAEILAQARADKVIVFKYKSKKNYRRKRGHRQYYTEVLIKEVNA